MSAMQRTCDDLSPGFGGEESRLGTWDSEEVNGETYERKKSELLWDFAGIAKGP
jgi:hypothetical protein